MAQIVIDIPDQYVTPVLDAFAATYRWSVESGLTKSQFAKQQVAKFIKEVYQRYQADQASETARQTSVTETNQVIIT